MNFAALLAKLNIRLGDSNDFAFTPEEKTEILTEAVQDSYVVNTIWDDSLTFVTDTWRYAVPTGVTTVKDIYIKAEGNDPETTPLPFDVIDGYIQFKGGSNIIPNGSTLYIRGNYKYTIADTISEIALQDYILNLAQVSAMDGIGVKKILKFVKNDATVSEMVTIKRELENKVVKYRQRLPKEFQAA